VPLSSNVKGIDVSHYQEKVDWFKVLTSDIKFAMAKTTDGISFIDPEFKANWSDMKAVNILRGATHYYRTNNDPVAQAKHFISVVGMLDSTDLPPVLDIEAFDGVFGNEGLVRNVQIWLANVQGALKRKPIIYTNRSFWNQHMSGQFGDYPLWIAEYGVAEPKLPIGWSSWAFWQSTDKGTVSGIQPHVDLDFYNGTFEELLAFRAGSSIVNPTMTPAKKNGHVWKV
jgi:lysozyme